MIGYLEIIRVQLYRNYTTCHQTLNTMYMKNVYETSSLLWTIKLKMLNYQVGDDNYSTSVGILTLFAEATRIPQSQCSTFLPKLLREENKQGE